MKLIRISNYQNEMINDKLIADNIPDDCIKLAECMRDALNEKYSGENATYFFRLEDDDYELYKF